jgi:hypothetical protein
MDVHVHLFERIVQLQNGRELGGPMKTIFALKKYNKGKLHSHNWFFNGFARNIMPEYTVLVDVGTVPTKTAIWRLLRSMVQNPRIAGVCGEIEIEPKSLSYMNFTIATQNFEYKISHILDKSLESSCGFISVLPGAFSAYRFETIQGKPLDEYFTLEHEENKKNASPFTVNMYLAEDRILCFELLAAENKDYILHYVKDAVAYTDPPDSFAQLVSQRRRWLNGSGFAMIYCIWNFSRFWRNSTHSLGTKYTIMILFFFYVMQVTVSFLLIGNFYITFYLIIQLAMPGTLVGGLLQLLYLFVTGASILLSMGHTPTEVKAWHGWSITVYALLTIITFLIAFWAFGQMFKAQLGSGGDLGIAKVWMGSTPVTTCTQDGLGAFATQFFAMQGGGGAGPTPSGSGTGSSSGSDTPKPAPTQKPTPPARLLATAVGSLAATAATSLLNSGASAERTSIAEDEQTLAAAGEDEMEDVTEDVTEDDYTWAGVGDAATVRYSDGTSRSLSADSHHGRRLANVPDFTSACPGYQVGRMHCHARRKPRLLTPSLEECRNLHTPHSLLVLCCRAAHRRVQPKVCKSQGR